MFFVFLDLENPFEKTSKTIIYELYIYFYVKNTIIILYKHMTLTCKGGTS